MIFFLTLGSFRSSIEGDEIAEIDVEWTVATYFAAPIIGLDVYISKGIKQSTYIGEHAFRDYYDYARIFGANYKRSQFHKDDFYVGKGSSNVYTGMYYWLSDFSIFGACIYAIFIGWIVGFFYRRKVNYGSIIECYFRSYIYFCLCMMFFDDQFNNIFSLFLLFKFFFIVYVQKHYINEREVSRCKRIT